jgi:hypothetical protein
MQTRPRSQTQTRTPTVAAGTGKKHFFPKKVVEETATEEITNYKDDEGE